MTTRTIALEKIDNHIQAADLSGPKPSVGGAAGTAAAIADVCKAYYVIKPIILLIPDLPIPKKWRDTIDGSIQVMD